MVRQVHQLTQHERMSRCQRARDVKNGGDSNSFYWHLSLSHTHRAQTRAHTHQQSYSPVSLSPLCRSFSLGFSISSFDGLSTILSTKSNIKHVQPWPEYFHSRRLTTMEDLIVFLYYNQSDKKIDAAEWCPEFRSHDRGWGGSEA